MFYFFVRKAEFLHFPFQGGKIAGGDLYHGVLGDIAASCCNVTDGSVNVSLNQVVHYRW